MNECMSLSIYVISLNKFILLISPHNRPNGILLFIKLQCKRIYI